MTRRITADTFVALAVSFALAAAVIGFTLWRLSVVHDVPADAVVVQLDR